MDHDFRPFVPADSNEREMTMRAVVLGILMALVLGAANAFVGMKAGLTISAMFPAAVVALAVFRLPFINGGVLEQNISRTVASVGEALAAGAIFTIPAFLIIKDGTGQPLWTGFNYWETTFMILAGGLLGILLVIVLRRPICVEMDLPFPESLACAEIVKAGQKGASGGSYIFGALGLGALVQIFKDDFGIPLIRESVSRLFAFPKSMLRHVFGEGSSEQVLNVSHGGGVPFQTPAASPMLVAIGYIIGPKLAALNFSGSLFAWLVIIPLILFMDSSIGIVGAAPEVSMELVMNIWYDIVRPIAVGAMLVGTVHTLIKMRGVISSSIKGALKATGFKAAIDAGKSRLDIDLPLRWIMIGTVALTIPIAALYYYFTKDLLSAAIAAVLMLVVTFLLNAIGGYLIGLIGLSNQPLSGLTLTALILAAVLMVALGHTGREGMLVVLAVTSVVCVALSTSGDIVQDLKVGHILGGTPWKMELTEIIGIVIVSFGMVFPLIVLHNSHGIGSEALPAPQAGLMAQLISGIVGGSMAWGLMLIGVMIGLFLILIGAPSPMLIAVGMYLPFRTTFAIFIGGIFKWIVDLYLERKNVEPGKKEQVGKHGVLLASGFIAGEALCGVLLAALSKAGTVSLLQQLSGSESLPIYAKYGAWLGLLIFAGMAYMMISLPLKAARK